MSVESEIDRLPKVKERLAEKRRQGLASDLEEIRKEMPEMVARAERLDAAIVEDGIEDLTTEWHLGSDFEGTEYPSRFLEGFAYPDRVYKSSASQKEAADLLIAKNRQIYIECFVEYVLPYKLTNPEEHDDLTITTIHIPSFDRLENPKPNPEEDFMLFFDSVYGMVRDLRELNQRESAVESV